MSGQSNILKGLEKLEKASVRRNLLQPPNILLITSDQHHYSALGATNPKISTPALKAQLLHEFMQATLQSEPERMPRIAGA
jgi:hypothetical protein